MSFLSEADHQSLRQAGRDPDVVLAELAALRAGPQYVALHRPCTVGDGIWRLTEEERARYAAVGAEAARAGRVLSFVPASGAATRLFQDIAQAKRSSGLNDLAVAEGFHDVSTLEAVELERRILERFGACPKGLVPFHRYPDGARTAFEEHLVEAATLCRDESRAARLHFTVSADHQSHFAAAAERARKRFESSLNVRFEVGFSIQSPSTDTVALTQDGRPVRENGEMLFRPGGHGALLENLAGTRGDIVLLKNIDNVVADAHRGDVLVWRFALLGLLADLEARARRWRTDLEATDARVRNAAEFLEAVFSVRAPAGADLRRFTINTLNRPLRVCGMVRNDGQPGGGPFFVRSPSDPSLGPQVVEQAEIDPVDSNQQRILAGATHFNPVDMAVGLCDHDGQAWNLGDFVDESRRMISRKSHQGESILILEHPGLWNGGMARWNSVFVEIPRKLFAPVKRIEDLLQEAHR